MNSSARNSSTDGYTRDILERVDKYRGTSEHTVIRELCAAYDYLCNCAATTEARVYLKGRIATYQLKCKQTYE